MTKTVLIIGAGVGGLACAIRLRHAGYHVILLEKNALVGGKMYQHESDGYCWDTGPSVITMRDVFEDLFAHVGRKLEDYLTLLPIDPLTRYFYTDGTVFDAVADTTHMDAHIHAIEPRDVAGYRDYLAYARRIHAVTGPVFIYDQPPTLASFARVPINRWLDADPLRTMQQAINARVQSPYLRQLLGRFATYVGGSPFQAPATLNVIADVELSGGIWYPQGGIYRIAEALQTLALELGVEIRTQTPVASIRVENGKAIGVVLASGETLSADVIVANADVTTVSNNLLPAGSLPARRLKALTNYEPSCSGFIMMLGVSRTHSTLAHHNIFFSDDYHAEFDAIFRQRQPPANPTIYVCITNKTDPQHAPTGHENWFILVNAPAKSPAYDWQTHTETYKQVIYQRLADSGYDVKPHVTREIIWTPDQLENMSGAWRGALYGPSANNRFTVFRRPHNRSKDVCGLYFAGGTTHPGGGVPMVMLSGKVAAEMVLEDNR